MSFTALFNNSSILLENQTLESIVGIVGPSYTSPFLTKQKKHKIQIKVINNKESHIDNLTSYLQALHKVSRMLDCIVSKIIASNEVPEIKNYIVSEAIATDNNIRLPLNYSDNNINKIHIQNMYFKACQKINNYI